MVEPLSYHQISRLLSSSFSAVFSAMVSVSIFCDIYRPVIRIFAFDTCTAWVIFSPVRISCLRYVRSVYAANYRHQITAGLLFMVYIAGRRKIYDIFDIKDPRPARPFSAFDLLCDRNIPSSKKTCRNPYPIIRS